jgi:hypothetical protein
LRGLIFGCWSGIMSKAEKALGAKKKEAMDRGFAAAGVALVADMVRDRKMSVRAVHRPNHTPRGPYSTSGGELGRRRDHRRDGKSKCATFASVVEEPVPENSEIDLCLRLF